jgi:hypothetical protein
MLGNELVGFIQHISLKAEPKTVHAFMSAWLSRTYGVRIDQGDIDYFGVGKGCHRASGYIVRSIASAGADSMFEHADYVTCLRWVFENCEEGSDDGLPNT